MKIKMRNILSAALLIILLSFPHITIAKDIPYEDYYEIIGNSFKEEFPCLKKVEFTDLKAINVVNFSNNNKFLSVTDGNELIVLDVLTLEKIRRLCIKDNNGQSLSSYWTATNFIISPDQKYILILDKYINIESGNLISKLEINAAITKGNPNPEPLVAPGSPSSTLK